MQSVWTPSSWHDYFPAFSAIFSCHVHMSMRFGLAMRHCHWGMWKHITLCGPTLKRKQCGFLCLVVCLFVWSLVCLCVVFLFFPLRLFEFLCFLMIDDTHALAIHISRGTCTRGDIWIANEFNKHHQNQVKVRIIVVYVEFENQFFWMVLKPNTFRMSLPKVIMIANTFTMSILCVTL